MIRLLFTSIILIVINACSYEPLLSSKNFDFELIIESTAGNENVNKICVVHYYITNGILNAQSSHN